MSVLVRLLCTRLLIVYTGLACKAGASHLTKSVASDCLRYLSLSQLWTQYCTACVLYHRLVVSRYERLHHETDVSASPRLHYLHMKLHDLLYIIHSKSIALRWLIPSR